MSNPFRHSDNNKRYLTLAYHNRKVFGGRVYKASLEIGCLCPNFDGKSGTGGCTFCEGPSKECQPLGVQLAKEASRISQKKPDAQIQAYFQTGTNTYCDPGYLYAKCMEVLEYPNVVGISIGTRADCLTPYICDMLHSLALETYLTVELGLQTIHDETAKRINRCHSFEQFLKGYKMLYSRGIRTCVHLINSLPGETPEMMIDTAKVLGELQPGGVKIHMLNILDGTAMANEYALSPFPMLTREEYVDVVVRQLEYFHENTVIERLTGDGIKNRIIAPNWVKDKLKTLVEIDKRQVLLNSYQGKAYQ